MSVFMLCWLSLILKELGYMPYYDLRTSWEEKIQEMRGPIKESFKLSVLS